MMDDSPATHRFNAEDQERFAAFCGDRNPMHMDPDAARRTQAGACAVHGVHGVLWALDRLRAAGVPLGALLSLKADFARFVTVGERVALVVLAREPDRLRAELHVDGARATALDLRFGTPADLPPPPTRPPVHVPDRPVDVPLDTMEGQTGRLVPPGAAATDIFPDLGAVLGPDRLRAIGLASTLVGMIVPGLHSIFSSLTLRFGPPEGPEGLGFEVRRADARFRLVTVDLEGPGFRGSLTAFLRFPPVALPDKGTLAGLVAPDEFAGWNALVIGGSRGIGAVTALLVAAGGGKVTATYHSGRAEAEALRAEIGAGRCTVARYDAGGDAAAQLAGLGGGFSHVYYFATGRIGAGGTGFDRAAFDRYADVYLDGFARLAEHVGATASAPVALLYPSTVYVEARPRGLGAYAMAKAAGEVLCSELARNWPNLRITAPRLPRILTDQTATVPPVPAEDPVAVMLPLLRAAL